MRFVAEHTQFYLHAKYKTMRKKLFWVAFVCAIVIPIVYYQLWYSPPKTESGIFKPTFTYRKHQSDVWTARFSPDGKYVLSASVDSTARVWDPSNGTDLLTLRHPSGITCAIFSQDGKWIATSAYDSKVRIWSFPEGKLVHELSGHANTVWTLSISHDSKQLASAGEDKVIRIWDIETGKLVQQLTGHGMNIWDIKFNPVKPQLASGSFDRTVNIWDVLSGKSVKTITEHTQAVVSLEYTDDGKYLASTSDDKTVKIWNTENWSLYKNLEVPEHVQAVAFSPDGKWLIAGGRDKAMMGELLQNFMGDSQYNKGISMRLWDIVSGKLLQTFSVHANDVNDLDYSPDGKHIVSASADHTVIIWSL